MFKGLSTLEAYEKCIAVGLCDQHMIDFDKESSIEERSELQRKAFLYIRLRILDPLLFGKKFIFEKMEALLSKSDFFPSKSSNQEKNNFIDNILLLDSVVVFTLCHFCKICCCGCLFQSNQTVEPGNDPEAAFIQKLLNNKNVTENDIRHFNPVLQENFNGYDKSLIKFCYVVALLFVRNTTIKVRLKQALMELTSELQKLSTESKKWLEIAKEAGLKKNYEESLEAITSALNYNPYCYQTLAVRGVVYIRMKNYKKAQLDGYISTIINPLHLTAYCNLSLCLIQEKSFQDCLKLLQYALKKCHLDYNQTVLDLEKMIETEKLFDNISLLKHFEEVLMICCDLELNITKDFSHLIRIAKSDVENSFINQFKNSSIEIEDIPDLEAQDSEDDTEVPDLSDPDLSDDASKSDEGDNKDTECAINKSKTSSSNKDISASETKSDVPRTKKLETKMPEADGFENKSSKLENKELPNESSSLLKGKVTKQLNELLKEGSQMLLDGCGYSAVNQFISAMDIIDTTAQNYEACEVVCIKYACGLAYYSSGGYDDLLKSIEVFKQIIEIHKNVTFPAAYYGIGLALSKLNRFKDALKYLQLVSDILEKGIRFKVYTWPGLKTVISETKLEQLKSLVSCKIRECEMPPPPDAICRYEECSTQHIIYYSDPDFKGFVDLQCSDHCNLQYHAVCWKSLKGLKTFTDKEFLEKTCLTPDCNGIIIKVEIIDKEGAVDKVFRSVQEKKSAKPKKSKPPKRMDSKEDKRKRRQSHRESESEKTSLTEEIVPNNKENSQNEKPQKEKNESSATPLSVNAEPFIIIKKEKLKDENVLKTPAKSKEFKKARPISLKEFCQEGEASHQDPQSITYQENNKNFSYVKEEWPQCSEVGSNFYLLQNQEVPVVEENNSTPTLLSELNCDPLEIEDFDAIKNNLYNYLEEFLTRNGPLSVKNVKLIRELETFPTVANVVIAKYGGVTEFLKNDIEYRFGIVDDLFVCSINDLADAYKLSRSSGVIDTGNADFLQEYGTHSTHLNGSLPGPTLNPDAKEYRPSSSVASSSTNSYTSLPEEVPSDSKTRPLSSSVMSTISKLRQPIAVDDEGANNFLQDHFLHEVSKSASVQKEGIKTPAETCIAAVKLYFSADMNSQRAYINSNIKPYRIFNSLDMSSEGVQTEAITIKTESKGTMTTDDEMNGLNETIKQLTEKMRELQVQKTLVETKLTSEMDIAAKCNKKALVEIEYLKKELEDSKIALETLKKESRSKEMKLEREHKVLMESLNKSAELNAQQEKEINIWCLKNQSLQEKLKTMEGCIEENLNETFAIKKSLVEQVEKHDSSVKIAETEKLQLMKRAKFAEVQLLQFKKEVFISKIESKSKEAKSRMKEIEDFLPMVNSTPLYKKNMELLHTSISNYIKKLSDLSLDLKIRCDEQITAVNNGVLLESLTPVEAKELPEMPSFQTQLSTSNSAMAMYNAAAQMMFTGHQAGNSNSMFVAHTQNTPNTVNRPPSTIPPPSSQLVVPPGLSDSLKELSATDSNPAKIAIKETFHQTSSALQTNPSSPLATTVTKTSVLNRGVMPKIPPTPLASLPVHGGASKKSADDLPLELDYKGKKDSEKFASSSSLASNQSTTVKGSSAGKSCDKLLAKLKSKYPVYDEGQLMSFIKEFRKSRKNGLSGLTIENIVSCVGALIDSQNQPKQPTKKPEVKSKAPQNKLVNKKLVEEKPLTEQKVPLCPWGPSKSEEKNIWSGSALEEGCIICYEEMTPSNAYKVDCGHCFHLKCIREWLNKKSDCPICRVHLLLPEDYPALK